MRKSVMPKTGLPFARIVAVALLAGTAVGCSSDASRFSSVFDKDQLTTASIPHRQITGLNNGAPIPAADVAGAGMSVQPTGQDYTSRSQAMSQPFPAAPGQQTYGGVNTSTARVAAQPADVQRVALAAPTPAPAAPAQQTRQQALAQPVPPAPAARAGAADPLVTGTSGAQNSAASRSANPAILPAGSPTPKPAQAPEQNLAVLPSAGTAREREQALNQPLPDKPGAGKDKPTATAGAYTVKAGDSLTKIAKANGVSVDALKAANGLSDANIRVGQTLKLPSGGGVDADAVKTASVPAAEPKKPTPAAYTPPVETSVGEVASADPKVEAPQATGIGKYRWPVQGAVVSRYGENVDGKRNDGINISVPSGTAIKAAENGVVIYAGNGLKELGNTVLLRHDDGTVTVYGHADSLAVNRGQKVQRGQQIATSGMSGSASRPMLHFEVRKEATPVNPMTFLE